MKKVVKINKVIKVMIFSDLFLNAGWGLIGPILAVFVVNNVSGGDVKVVGIAAGIYWLVKSFLQIPIASFLDKNHGEKDDLIALVLGTLLAAVTPILYIFATSPWHIYVAQIIHALGMAMAIPSWYAIFGRHIPKKREAVCWGLESSVIGLGAGIAGIAGGILVDIFGFKVLFISVAVLNISAGLLLLLISKNILPKVPQNEVFPFPKS